MKCFVFKVSVVSYVFLYADFGKKILNKTMARTVFTQIENLCMERVEPGEKVYIANVSSRLSYFPENLDSASEEEGVRFHQDIKKMEQRYQSR